MDEFRDIFERHYVAVRRFALFLTQDFALADDLTAETFVRAWLARQRIQEQTVRAYLLTIARNLHRDQCRAAKLRFVGLDEGLVDTRPGSDIRVEQQSTLNSVKARLRRVSRGDRHALLLYVVREMSYEEIASALGVSVGAVKSRIARACETLKAPASLEPNGENPS
jgi:RNA polymerase sigma-70 factor, ECF subfamily